MTTIAQRLFDADAARADLEERLEEEGIPFNQIGWDSYDHSLELHGIPADYQPSAEAKLFLHSLGFIKVYINHDDKWETHYTFDAADFAATKRWRVSYPHKRGEEKGSIWVEEIIPGWPQQWFESGYCIVKPATRAQSAATAPVADSSAIA